MCSIVRKIGYLKPQRLNRYLFNNNTPILDMYHDAIMQTANLSTFANCISVTSFILQVSFGDSGYTKIGKVKIFLQNFCPGSGLGQEELEGDTGETAGVVTPISKM